MTDTTVAIRQQHPIVVLRERLEQRTSEIKAALPGIPPERFIRAVITAAQINPDILACEFQSLWLACMRACRDGLLPDGVEGAIVPYKSKATWIPMYRGMLRKFQESGQFRWVAADVVHVGEQFEYWITENGPHFKHKPEGGGAVVRAYAIATTQAGGVFVAVMSMHDLDKVRAMSRASRDDAPWKTWPEEMMKKSALRRLSKMLPSAPLLDDDEPELEAPATAPAPIARAPGAAAALDQFSRASPASGDNPHPVAAIDDAREEGGEQGTAAASAAHDAASGDPAAVDDHTEHFEIVNAFKAGQLAKSSGHQRKALPGELRDPKRSREAIAWTAGWEGEPMPEFGTEGE
jgi:recombination protein RecT